MIKTIIFDIGNVLITLDWNFYDKNNRYDTKTKERIAAATYKSPIWNEFDRGVWTNEEIVDHFVENDPELETEIREMCRSLAGLCVRCDYALPWILEWKERGFQVLVLSNFSAKAEADCADTIDFLEAVDGGFLSYKEKLIKPDPEIYRKIMQDYSIQPGEAVFLDDTYENIAAAEKEGIHGIWVQSHEQAVKDLERLVEKEGQR